MKKNICYLNNITDKDKNMPKKGKVVKLIILSIPMLMLLILILFIFVPSAFNIFFATNPMPSPSSTTFSFHSPIKAENPISIPSPIPTPATTPLDSNAKYFSASERINVNSDKTEWTYNSSELYIDIKKYDKTDLKLHYFVADIRTRGTEIFKSGFSDETHPGSNALLPNLVARKLSTVFLLNGDYFEDTRNPRGVVIRHGVVYRDDKNADTLAIMPDGTLKAYEAGEVNAASLLASGVQDTFSFGPWLVNNGVKNPNLDKAHVTRANPRTGIGMIDKGHYVAIVVEGRNPQDNRGVTLKEYAQMFVDLGCTVAYNLDGGASSAMDFMGNTLNLSTDALTTKTYRRVPDVLTIGTSDAVPAYK